MTTQVKFYKGNSDYPATLSLFPKQKELIELAHLNFNVQGFSLMKLGQRSGKSIIAAEVARKFKQVFLFDEADTIQNLFPVPYAYCGSSYKEAIEEGAKEGKLAILSEAMWMVGSFDLFEEIRQHSNVLVISSNGPEFEDRRWKALPGHSYATWDVNPNVSKDQLLNDDDPMSQRDFGAF